MRAAAFVVLALLLAGCQAVPSNDPSLPGLVPGGDLPLLRVLAAQPTLAPCDPANPFPVDAVCHEAEVHVAALGRSGEVPVQTGWSGANATGALYVGHVARGPIAVAAGGQGVVRVRFALPTGSDLVEVRWSTPMPSGMQTEGAAPHGFRTIAAAVPADGGGELAVPPITLLGAERAFNGCRNLSWCTVADVEVDNRLGATPFPGANLWFVEGQEPGSPWSGVSADGTVPAGEVGVLRLQLDHWAPMQVGIAIDGWGVPAFALPHVDTLPIKDQGADLRRIELAQTGQATSNATTGDPEVPIGILPQDRHTCSPFAGRIDFRLQRQSLTGVNVEPLWHEVRTWSIAVVPDDFWSSDGHGWCMLEVLVGDEEQLLGTNYRLLAAAVPDATGDAVTAETWFSL